MSTDVPATTAASPDLPARVQRLERRLELVRKIVSHDMPNQLVVIHGLIQLLALDEVGRFSADGQECMRRLSAASARAQDMMQMLKTILGIGTRLEIAEQIALAEAVGEMAAEIKQLFPGAHIEYHLGKDASAVRTGRKSLQQALSRLGRLALEGAASTTLIVSSRRADGRVEIWLGPRLPPAVLPAEDGSGVWSNRLEWLLIRELAETWGGSARLVEEAARARFFVLTAPSGDLQSLAHV